MPCLKLSNVVKNTKHSGVFQKVVAEALKERHGKDKDIDEDKTSKNIYFGFETAEKLIAYSENFISNANAEIEKHNRTAHAGARQQQLLQRESLIREREQKKRNQYER